MVYEDLQKQDMVRFHPNLCLATLVLTRWSSGDIGSGMILVVVVVVVVVMITVIAIYIYRLCKEVYLKYD